MGKAFTFLGTLLSIITGVIFLFQYCSDDSSYAGQEPVIENVDDTRVMTDSIIDDSDSGSETTGQELDNIEVPDFDFISFDHETKNNYLTCPFALVVKNVKSGSLNFTVRMIVYDEFPSSGVNNSIHQQGRAIYDESFSETNVDPDYARLELVFDGVSLDRLQLSKGEKYYLVLQVIYNGEIMLTSAPKPYSYAIGY